MRLHGALLLGSIVWSSHLTAADDRDAAIQAAIKALDSGQAVAALQVLNGHPAAGVPGKVRLIQARALLALGRHHEAAARLGLGDVEQLDAWPESLRAAASAVAGEISLASGALDAARPQLERALRLRGEGVAIDRTMVLLAECSERQGDTATALRYAHAVWRDWARSPLPASSRRGSSPRNIRIRHAACWLACACSIRLSRQRGWRPLNCCATCCCRRGPDHAWWWRSRTCCA